MRANERVGGETRRDNIRSSGPFRIPLSLRPRRRRLLLDSRGIMLLNVRYELLCNPCGKGVIRAVAQVQTKGP